jgi:Ca2+-binding EF-hand superfamily protein
MFKDSTLVDRIFSVFDLDDDGVISFTEYIACLSILSSKATSEEKLKCNIDVIVDFLTTVGYSYYITHCLF